MRPPARAAGRLAALGLGLALLVPAGLAWAQEGLEKAGAPASPAWETDLTLPVVKMIMALGLVLALLLGLYALMRRWLPGQAGAAGEGGLRLLARLPLGPKQGVAVVEVAGRVLVLGYGEQTIHLLSVIDDPAQIERLARGRGGFGRLLKKASQAQAAQAGGQGPGEAAP